MRKVQAGFTLIELVVVIVILGILAAAALPRFVNLSDEARVAAVQGLAGGMRSAVAIVQAQYFAKVPNASPVTMQDGTSVTVGTSGTSAGVPTGNAAGIGAAMQSIDGFTADYTVSPNTFRPTNGGSATCQVTYDASTGVVATVTSGC